MRELARAAPASEAQFVSGHPSYAVEFHLHFKFAQERLFLCRVVINCPCVNSRCLEFSERICRSDFGFQDKCQWCIMLRFYIKEHAFIQSSFRGTIQCKLGAFTKKACIFRTIQVPQDFHTLTKNKCRIAVDNPLP